MSDEAVVIEELACAHLKVGRLTLNVPKTLNSLTLPMVDTLQQQLDAWRDDPTIAAVFIDGSGEKAFCAGGDVQALHRSATATPGGPCEEAEAFFAREYRMNYTLHTWPKPIICWGHGIVMGGGLGVMAGCSHRVVTEATRIAMPGKAGQFLALTGASINAADAVFTGIADRFIGSEHKATVLEQLRRSRWSDDTGANHAQVRHILRPLTEQSVGSMPGGQVEPHLRLINALCDGDDVHQVVDTITGQQTDDPWLAKARDGLAHGSPLAALWISRQLQETRHASLREVFQAEIVLATNIVRYPEFAEGVRALLLDKDRNPAWAYKTTRDVPEDLLDAFFRAPWAENPLADL